MSASFTGIGGALPRSRIRNDNFPSVTDAWIRQRTGVVERRWCDSEESLVELAGAASSEAVVDADLNPDDIDCIIVATTTHNPNSPALAPLLATRIGAGVIPAFDVNAACSGFLYALMCATALISQGCAKNVLVCAAEKMSPLVCDADPSVSVLFGDGAGAVVLSRTPCSADKDCSPKFFMSSDGHAGDLLYIDSLTERLVMKDGVAVYARAVNSMAESIENALSAMGMVVSDIDLVIPHQANSRIVSAVRSKLGLKPDRMVDSIALTGNTSAASIPLALWGAHTSGRLKPGNRLALAAFGAGVTWGAGIVGWRSCVC